jgi:multidrug efflux pump subunit AcrA (membrane-fusion protein)
LCTEAAALDGFRIVIDARPRLTAIVNGDPNVRVSILRLDLSHATVTKPLPYVKVGNRVTPGQTVCIIEAMKIMNEIEAEIAGVVREISVEDGQPVEFGQALFRVDPNG